MTAPTPPPAAQPTVNVPIVGTVPRRWLYVGGAAAAVVVAYMYLAARRRANSPATFDPATGTPTSGGTYVNPNPNADGSSDTVDSTPESIDTNAAWSRAVLVDLSGVDINAQFALEAIGKYLAAPVGSTVPMTADELRVVRSAWALRGKPPQGAAEPVLASGPSAPPPPPETSAPVTYETVYVSEGNHVEVLVNMVRTYKPGFSEGELLALNPGLKFARANDNGYINADNPDTGFSRSIFGYPAPVKIPARPSA